MKILMIFVYKRRIFCIYARTIKPYYFKFSQIDFDDVNVEIYQIVQQNRINNKESICVISTLVRDKKNIRKKCLYYSVTPTVSYLLQSSQY